jgi:OOP family OmpA-OmpF porin
MALGLLAGSPALADTTVLEMPAPSSVIGGRAESPGTYPLPVGPFAGDAVPVRRIEGALDQRAYRLDSRETTLQLLQPLRGQLQAAGFAVIYECDTAGCGGFDFRYGMEVLPEPQMHVDLGDFRYLAAERQGEAGQDYVGVLVSRSADQGFVQVTSVGALGETPTPVVEAPQADATAVAAPELGSAAAAPEVPATDVAPAAQPAAGGLGARLEQQGALALDDLVFGSGKAVLEDKDYASLAELAEWLKAHPDRRVTLVGHTDASGGLAGNIALSKQRAASVRSWLIAHYGVTAAQVDAQGAGYLAPRDTNLTEAGRNRNRRVEVMLTSIQ